MSRVSPLTSMSMPSFRKSFTKDDSSPGGRARSTSMRIATAIESQFKNVKAEEDKEDFDLKHIITKLKSSTKLFLDTHFLGIFYTYMILIISVLSCFEYIFQTYLDPNGTKYDIAALKVLGKLELAIACLFLMDWCLQLFIADSRTAYATSFFSIIDLTTVIPIFVTYGHTCPSLDEATTSAKVIQYILCGLTTTRILRALRIRRQVLKIENKVNRQLTAMAMYILVMILFNAALLQFFEPQLKNPYHAWMYFAWCTMATVGYGEFTLTPKTPLGRFADMLMISISFITIPKMTNDLLAYLAEESVYARASYNPNATRKMIHVIICGDVKSSSMKEFFEELFHEDHEIENLQAVILQPTAPSYEIQTILKDEKYNQNVIYLEGNALSEKDLRRASAETARAIFIMTNKFTSDPDEEDAGAILRQFSIRRYLVSNCITKHKTLFCMQLIRPENKRHLVEPAEGAEVTDLVACLNEIKMGVIAKAALFPGANALIMNLLTSFADEDNDSRGAQYHEALGIETLEEDTDNHWMGEYQSGCDWEIYTTKLADAFEGSVFGTLSELLYDKLGVVLFAVRVEDRHKEKNSVKLLLNPATFVIPSKDHYKIEAFVLAKNKAQSDLTFSKSDVHHSIFNDAARRLSVAPAVSMIKSRMNMGHVKVDPDEPRQTEWQKLLRSKDTSKKTTESIQEELHKREDQYLKENFFLKDILMDMNDAIIRTSVHEEIPYVDGHIIIIGKALSNLYDLIKPLRSKHLGLLKHIVILYPFDFPVAVWQRISIFESIWIVRGSALDEADIRRAGIFRAKQVIVLADAAAQALSSSKAGSAAVLESLTDADAIFCYQCVKRMNESAHVVVEIVRHTNVIYLDPESSFNSGSINYRFTPEFASGALFASSFLDTLVCQSFYNARIIDVVNKLIGSVDNTDLSKKQNIKGATSATGLHKSSSLYQINIPDGLESKTYGSLFKFLIRRHQIPLGILRGVLPHTKLGPKSNKMPYVFTNPSKDTELFSCDKIFILSQTPIRLGKIKDESREMSIHRSIRQNRKTSDDVITMVNVLNEDLQFMEKAQYDLQDKLQDAAIELETKFDKLCQLVADLEPANAEIFKKYSAPIPYNKPKLVYPERKVPRPASAGARPVSAGGRPNSGGASRPKSAGKEKPLSIVLPGSRPDSGSSRPDSGKGRSDSAKRPVSAGRPTMVRRPSSVDTSMITGARLGKRQPSFARQPSGSILVRGDSAGSGLLVKPSAPPTKSPGPPMPKRPISPQRASVLASFSARPSINGGAMQLPANFRKVRSPTIRASSNDNKALSSPKDAMSSPKEPITRKRLSSTELNTLAEQPIAEED